MESLLPQKKLENLQGSLLRHYVTGLRQIKSATVLLQPEEYIIINKTYVLLLVALKLISRSGKLRIVESLQKNKWTTLKDKKTFSNSTTLITTWLQMLRLELIGTEKVFKPFWNNQVKEISQRLWLPTETDSVASHSNWLSTSSNLITSNSLLSMTTLRQNQILTKTSPTISCPLSTLIPVEKWEGVDIQKTRKIRIYPTLKQNKIFKEWMTTSRYVYNRCVEEIQKCGLKSIDRYALRDKFVTAEYSNKDKNPNITEWEINTPKGPRDGAVRDLMTAYKAAFTNLREGNIRGFKVNYRSKRNGFQSIEIPKTAIEFKDSKLTLFPSYGIGNINVSKREARTLVGKPSHYCRLKVDQCGDWYILVPVNHKTKKISKNKKCSLDPGIRKFQTMYSPNGEVIKATTNQVLLKELQKKISHYQSLRSGKKISKQSLRKQVTRSWKRHRNLITDFQFKFSHYLASNYSEIFLPKFESQKLAKNLRPTSNFNLFNLQHYKFKERLRFQCLEQGSKLTDCTEEYTSKTCTQCGKLNENLGYSEIFVCPCCSLNIDRDVNGARNIYLKNITE